MKPQSSALGFLDAAIADARRQNLLRERLAPATPGPSFCSNDYLGLATLLAPAFPAGAGASRLLGGDRDIHAELEREAARWVGLEEALVFPSGYATNLGVISALAGPGDLVVSDRLNHASIIDGARLSRARIEVVPHLDVAAVDRALQGRGSGRAYVVTEGYFSMDADSPDLAALRRVCDRHGAALMVDEAHSLGVLGPEGRGMCAGAGVVPDVLVGTFGKAFGAAGAFVAGSPSLVLWCWNRARSLVFSTAMSPASAAAALQGMHAAAMEPERRVRVLASARALRGALTAQGLHLLGEGPIIPWVIGDARAAMEAAEALRLEGLDVRAVRPPTVPQGTARLRLTVTASHTAADIERAAALIGRLAPR